MSVMPTSSSSAQAKCENTPSMRMPGSAAMAQISRTVSPAAASCVSKPSRFIPLSSLMWQRTTSVLPSTPAFCSATIRSDRARAYSAE